MTLDAIKSDGYINLRIEGPSDDYEFTWIISLITKDSIVFKLDFTDPRVIGAFNVRLYCLI